PGETPPAIEPDDLNASDIAEAVGEAQGELDAGVAAEINQVPAAATNAVVQHVDHPPGLALWKKAKRNGDWYFAKTSDGKEGRLTIEPKLEASMEKLLRMYKPVGAAVVALDPKTGKVITLAEIGEGSVTKPAYPAASVFKIVTGAALLEKGI